MKKISIRKFFIRYLIFAVALPLLLMSGIGILISSSLLKTKLAQADFREVRLIEESINHYLADPEEELKTVIFMLNNGFLASGSQISLLLESITQSHESLLGIQLADMAGNVLAVYPENDAVIGTDISGHDYFQQVLRTADAYWAPSFMSDQIDKPVASLSVQHKTGIATVFLSLDKIEKLAGEPAVNEKKPRMIIVTDQNGVFIAHPDKRKVLLREYDPLFLYCKKMWEERVRNHVVEYDGVKYMAHVTFMPNTNWKIALYHPLSLYYAPIKTLAAWLLFLTAAILSMAVLFGNRLGNKISYSFSGILKAALNIGKGNYQVAMPPVGFTELSQLAGSFKHMANDIQQREETILRTQRYIANIINSMPSIIIGVDTEFNITQWNHQAEQRIGLSVENALGRKIDEAVPRLSVEMDKIRKAILTGEKQVDAKRIHQQEDQVFYEDVTIYPLVSTDEEGVVIRLDDVTEQVRLEEMMVQSEKMLSVGGLAAGMAHEINNPLAGLIQTADVLANRLSNRKMPANVKAAESMGISMEAIHSYLEARHVPRMLSAMRESGIRVAEIVDNMLSFARKSDESSSSNAMDDLMEKILEIASTDYDLKKQYDFKNIEIVREYEKDLPLVICEGAKIQQVLLNILRNGAHAMQEKARMTEQYKPRFILRLACNDQKDMLCVEIEDNGPGMDERIRKRVFEPFFTTKPVGVGTGLGLSVSYFIVTENHGGKMSVESTPGIGTKFVICLPIKR